MLFIAAASVGVCVPAGATAAAPIRTAPSASLWVIPHDSLCCLHCAGVSTARVATVSGMFQTQSISTGPHELRARTVAAHPGARKRFGDSRRCSAGFFGHRALFGP